MYLGHVIFLLFLAAGAVYLMMFASLGHHALERRRASVCPSCGRDARDCRCRQS
jgi:hypothetical protein